VNFNEATEVSVRREPALFLPASSQHDGTKVHDGGTRRSSDDYQAMRHDLPHFRFFRKR